MKIQLTAAQAEQIMHAFGGSAPRAGHGVQLTHDAGSVEHEWHRGYYWLGTEQNLVRLSAKLGIIRSANHPTCHCGSGKMPGIMRVDLPKIGKRSQWCCGVCHNDRHHCPGERANNPVPLLTAALVKRQIGMRVLRGRRR